jgi:hypothetical protein
MFDRRKADHGFELLERCGRRTPVVFSLLACGLSDVLDRDHRNVGRRIVRHPHRLRLARLLQ